MAEFFDFTIWCAKEFVDFLFRLPFLDGISFGHILVAIVLLAVVITALVSSIAVANLSGEARSANRHDSSGSGDSGKKG